MIVLGLDTATADTCVGLYSDTEGLELELARHHRPAPGERPGHAQQLLSLAAAVLHEASLTWTAIDRIAVGVGPGTFTGLRIGVASARALAQASGTQLAGVSTLQALANGAVGDDAPVLACIDARRGEVFVGAWAGGTCLLQTRAVAPADLPALVAGLGGDQLLTVGDGAVRYRDAFGDTANIPADEDRRHHVHGLAVCRLARFAPVADRDALMPDYVRAPDAVRRPRSSATA
ncbi:MAG: peptidase glycoprotease [Solirubrobacterales bacterium]|nr:peptidase glycoprotease [Solirubrobacterales bacterium]